MSFDYLAEALPYPLDTIARGWGQKKGQAEATKVIPFMDEMNPFKIEQRGSLYTITLHGEREEIEQGIRSKNPIFSEVLPLSLEEIFISETEVAGYDIKSLIL